MADDAAAPLPTAEKLRRAAAGLAERDDCVGLWRPTPLVRRAEIVDASLRSLPCRSAEDAKEKSGGAAASAAAEDADADAATATVVATPREVSLKLENMQLMGSFKIRGVAWLLSEADREAAAAAAAAGAEEDAARTTDRRQQKVVTMSAGNFGRAFSFACGQRGIDCVVIMPETVPKDRVAVCEGFGARVELTPSLNLMKRVHDFEQQGYAFVHPFDDPRLFEGYASIGAEIKTEMPDVHTVVVGIGGGGLISGVAAALRLLHPPEPTQAAAPAAMAFKATKAVAAKPVVVEVIGVEPEGAPAMAKSIQAGKPVHLDGVSTIAAGLAPPFAGTNAFACVQAFVKRVITVNDTQIRDAQHALLSTHKVAVEASGAAAFAALREGHLTHEEVNNKNLCVVISGGNYVLSDYTAELPTEKK